QLLPSSAEENTNTRRVSLLVPAIISFSWSVPRFQVESNSTVPVLLSTTGEGFPQVFAASFHTISIGPQVLPASEDRFTTRSISPASPQLLRRASANASRVPRAVVTTAGMRKHRYPFSPLLYMNASSCALVAVNTHSSTGRKKNPFPCCGKESSHREYIAVKRFIITYAFKACPYFAITNHSTGNIV